MRVLIHTLSGWLTYAALRVRQCGQFGQFSQFSMDRRKVLLLVGSLACVMVGIVIWSATMSPTASSGPPRVMMDLPPTPSVAVAATPTGETGPPVVPRRDARRAESTADLVNPFSGMTVHEEQRARSVAQRVDTDQRRLELTKLAVEIAKQEQELARVRKETRDLLRPRARPVAPRVPAIPKARPLAIASQSALVLYRGVRVTTWPGSTLGAWTVDAIFPDGVMIRHRDRQAFLPLSFPSREVN